MDTYRNRIELCAALIPPGTIGAEVGVFEGAFAAQLLTACQPAHLHLIDLWVDSARFTSYALRLP